MLTPALRAWPPPPQHLAETLASENASLAVRRRSPARAALAHRVRAHTDELCPLRPDAPSPSCPLVSARTPSTTRAGASRRLRGSAPGGRRSWRPCACPWRRAVVLYMPASYHNLPSAALLRFRVLPDGRWASPPLTRHRPRRLRRWPPSATPRARWPAPPTSAPASSPRSSSGWRSSCSRPGRSTSSWRGTWCALRQEGVTAILATARPRPG